MRGSLASFGGVVVLTATLLVAPAAGADAAAQPTTVAGLLAHYHDLSQEAERVNEDLLVMQERLAGQQRASDAATKVANDATAAADAARGKVNTAQDLDEVADALSARRELDALSAFAASSSPDDLLGRLAAANLAQHLTGGRDVPADALAAAEAAEDKASAASAAATKASAKVARSAADMRGRQGDLDTQIADVRKALDHLTPDQRALLSGSEDYGDDVVIPAGNLGGIIKFTMSQMGKPYLWGAVGPASYDCSGLVQTAYLKAGVTLPRVSRQQATVGLVVPRGQVRAGDLIFYYRPVHHVAIAVDNVRAVHAPSFGETVKITPIDAIGPITIIRRILA
ncbi:MAG TPA: C40 family peptidase [Actinophytocola sp.]|nr:C40 family peptidase [Actinophytocola sp.]